MKDYSRALEDANKVTEIKPDWAKGWTRKGTALHGQGNLGTPLVLRRMCQGSVTDPPLQLKLLMPLKRLSSLSHQMLRQKLVSIM